jgi:TonB family protein
LRRFVTFAICLFLTGGCRYEPSRYPSATASKDPLIEWITMAQPPGHTRATALRNFEAGALPTGWDTEPAAKPLRVGGEVVAPVVLHRVEPDFSPCEGQRAWGFPILEAVIDETGTIRDVRMLKPVHPCLEKAVLESVRQWRFQPGTVGGKPVPVIFNMTVYIKWAR